MSTFTSSGKRDPLVLGNVGQACEGPIGHPRDSWESDVQLDRRRYCKTAHRWDVVQFLVVSVTRTRTLQGFDTFIPDPLPPRATLLHDVQRSVDVPGSHSRQFRGLGGVAGAKVEQVVGDKQLGEGQRTALVALDTVGEDTDALGVRHAGQAHLGL